MSNIRLTGPTPLPPEVQAAVSAQVMSHRSEEFRALQARLDARLRRILGSRAAALLLTCSGTGGLEAAVINAFEPGERVLVCSIGLFGDRLAELAAAAGLDVDRWAIDWGRAIPADELRNRIATGGPYAGVLLTHNETSTGVLNPLPELLDAIRGGGWEGLVVVDAISSAGAVPIDLDRLGIDMVVAASQKALMAPPGAAIVGLSEQGIAAIQRNQRPRYYFDLRRALAAAEEATSTFTPALPVYYALDTSTRMIEDEGLDAVYARHRRLRAAAHEELAPAGDVLFACPEVASPTVTAVQVPPGSAARIRRDLRRDHDVVVSQGRGAFKETMLRLGHMGHVDETEVRAAAVALRTEMSR